MYYIIVNWKDIFFSNISCYGFNFNICLKLLFKLFLLIYFFKKKFLDFIL